MGGAHLPRILIGGKVMMVLMVLGIVVRGIDVDIIIVVVVIVMVVVRGRGFHNGLPSYHNHTRGNPIRRRRNGKNEFTDLLENERKYLTGTPELSALVLHDNEIDFISPSDQMKMALDI